MVTLFDICVLTGAGLIGGICTGLLIRSKKIENLKEEIEAGDRSYMNLLDRYMELYSSHSNLKFAAREKSSKPLVKKRGPGRPKGSKNKPTAAKTGPKKRK